MEQAPIPTSTPASASCKHNAWSEWDRQPPPFEKQTPRACLCARTTEILGEIICSTNRPTTNNAEIETFRWPSSRAPTNNEYTFQSRIHSVPRHTHLYFPPHGVECAALHLRFENIRLLSRLQHPRHLEVRIARRQVLFVHLFWVKFQPFSFPIMYLVNRQFVCLVDRSHSTGHKYTNANPP